MTVVCPSCGDDITDTHQDDEPDVGLVGGWYCERCDELVSSADVDYEEDR